VILAVFAASCGVSRDDVTADGGTEATTEAAADDDGAASEGDEAADESATETTEQAETTLPPATAPPTTAAAADVAVTLEFSDGSTAELLHGPLNDIVGPTRANDEFVQLVYQGVVPPGFEAVVLSQTVLGEVMDNELAKLDSEPSDGDLDEARSLLFDQLQGLLSSSSDPAADAERLFGEVPYLPFIAGLQARQIALSAALASTAGLRDGNPCVRHILLETETDAGDVLTELEGGADFATLAAERSTGPTGPNGGDLGCAPVANYVAEFADAVTAAELGAFVGPVETQFGFHVILVERFEVNGDQMAQERLTEGLTTAVVTVDERVGTWDTTQLTIIPVQS